jgi:hypothetical protein
MARLSDVPIRPLAPSPPFPGTSDKLLIHILDAVESAPETHPFLRNRAATEEPHPDALPGVRSNRGILRLPRGYSGSRTHDTNDHMPLSLAECRDVGRGVGSDRPAPSHRGSFDKRVACAEAWSVVWQRWSIWSAVSASGRFPIAGTAASRQVAHGNRPKRASETRS